MLVLSSKGSTLLIAPLIVYMTMKSSYFREKHKRDQNYNFSFFNNFYVSMLTFCNPSTTSSELEQLIFTNKTLTDV